MRRFVICVAAILSGCVHSYDVCRPDETRKSFMQKDATRTVWYRLRDTQYVSGECAPDGKGKCPPGFVRVSAERPALSSLLCEQEDFAPIVD